MPKKGRYTLEQIREIENWLRSLLPKDGTPIALTILKKRALKERPNLSLTTFYKHLRNLTKYNFITRITKPEGKYRVFYKLNNPQRYVEVYDLVAEKGIVAFKEAIKGIPKEEIVFDLYLRDRLRVELLDIVFNYFIAILSYARELSQEETSNFIRIALRVWVAPILENLNSQLKATYEGDYRVLLRDVGNDLMRFCRISLEDFLNYELKFIPNKVDREYIKNTILKAHKKVSDKLLKEDLKKIEKIKFKEPEKVYY
ncbi:MAG: hypothetical protein ACTSP1_08190 [Candidatus Freyarchaeota archaeon]